MLECLKSTKKLLHTGGQNLVGRDLWRKVAEH